MLLNLFPLLLAYIHLVTMLASLFHLRVPFLSMAKLKQVSFCSFGLTKSFANIIDLCKMLFKIISIIYNRSSLKSVLLFIMF